MRTPIPADPVATTLFGKVRRDLLVLLFSHPDAPLYFRELVRLTGTSPGAVQRELGQLVEAGLLRRSQRGRQVFYQANRQAPVFPDLQALIEKTMGAADLLRAALAPLADRIRFALMFGSVARGTARPHSDVDVLVVGEVEFAELSDAVAAVGARLGREVSLVHYTPAQFTRRLHEGRDFLRRVLRSPVVPVIGTLDDARRVA